MGLGMGGEAMHADGNAEPGSKAAGGGDIGGFQFLPWQRVVRMAGLIVSGAGLAATVCMVFTTLLPPAQEFRDPLEAYTYSLWASDRYDYLWPPLVLGLAFASLVGLTFSPGGWIKKAPTQVGWWMLGLILVAMIPATYFSESRFPPDEAEAVLADPFVRALLVILACGAILLLALLWPVVSPHPQRPRRVSHRVEAAVVTVLALSYPYFLVLAAIQGSMLSIAWGGAFWYVLIIAGVFRRKPPVRARQDNGGAGEAGSKA